MSAPDIPSHDHADQTLSTAGILSTFIDQAPVAIAMFDCDMRYLAASRRWIERICGDERNVIGRSHYDVVPDIPQHWREINRRALAGEAVRIDEEPISGANGRAEWVRRDIIPWRDARGAIGGIVIFSEDVTAKVLAETARRESEERLRLAVTGSRMGMYDWDLRTDAVVWSGECYRMLGYQVGEIEPSKAAWMARIHSDDRVAAEAAQTRAKLEHKDFISEYRIIRRDDSVCWVLDRGRFLYDADKPVRMIGLKQDITGVKRQIETQRVLVGELQHRTRNLIAVVQSVAQQTLHNTESLGDFEDRFNRRLEALSRVQSLLSRADSEPITLGALVAMELDALAPDGYGDRITFGGPEAPMHKSAAEILSLAIHELLTNAIKYGALAGTTGRLAVTWRIEGMPPDQQLVLEWIESGIASAAPAAEPKRNGYGRTLIEEALPYSLSAETTFEFGADRLRWRISFPLAPYDGSETLA